MKLLVLQFATQVRKGSGVSLAKIEAALGIGPPSSPSGRTFWAYLHGERAMTRGRLIQLARKAHAMRNAADERWVSSMFLLGLLRDLEDEERQWNEFDRSEARESVLRDKAARKLFAPTHRDLKAALTHLLEFAASQGRHYRVDQEILAYSLKFPSETGSLEIRHLGMAVQEAMEVALSRRDEFEEGRFDFLRRSAPAVPAVKPVTSGRRRPLKGDPC